MLYSTEAIGAAKDIPPEVKTAMLGVSQRRFFQQHMPPSGDVLSLARAILFNDIIPDEQMRAGHIVEGSTAKPLSTEEVKQMIGLLTSATYEEYEAAMQKPTWTLARPPNKPITSSKQ